MDLRVTSGGFFALVGLILLALGLFWPELRAPLTETNVNFYCGTSLFLLGAALLLLARRP